MIILLQLFSALEHFSAANFSTLSIFLIFIHHLIFLTFATGAFNVRKGTVFECRFA